MKARAVDHARRGLAHLAVAWAVSGLVGCTVEMSALNADSGPALADGALLAEDATAPAPDAGGDVPDTGDSPDVDTPPSPQDAGLLDADTEQAPDTGSSPPTADASDPRPEVDAQYPDLPSASTPPLEVGWTSPPTPSGCQLEADWPYEPRGIGGGGAMSALSFSPYASLTFVGTDMGTVFRRANEGRWQAVDQQYVSFSQELASAAYFGFSADPQVVFHAARGIKPKRSTDAGLTWSPIEVPLEDGEKIRYWVPDSFSPNVVLAVTNTGVLRTLDAGTTWTRSTGVSGEGLGTFIDYQNPGRVVFHATASTVYVSRDAGGSFSSWYQPESPPIRSFAGGRDAQGVTLAFIDGNGASACAWVDAISWLDAARKDANKADCGYVWIKRDSGPFQRSDKDAGDFLRMAENDSQTIYVTGGRKWAKAYGSKVWVSRNAGQSWTLKFLIEDWDQVPYTPWPADKLEWSAVGLDVGWWDSFYESFAVNQRNSAQVGSTGWFFTHISYNYGDSWHAPFTEFADEPPRAQKKAWRSTGLEVTSALRMRFHPANPQLAYVAFADIGGLVSEDGGQSFRISQIEYNSNYDYAFDPAVVDRVYGVSGSSHDFPHDNWGSALVGRGGVYRSDDRGRTWIRLTPTGGALDRQFLSVAFDAVRGVLYAGTQGAGIARSVDQGQTWTYFNAGLTGASLIIPQIETDPANGNAYALLTGDRPTWTNSASTGIYFLDAQAGSTTWQLLRGTVNRPSNVGAGYKLLEYPTRFAVDFTRPGRDVLWMVDIENHFQWLATGAWKSTDRGTTWNRMTQVTHPFGIALDPADGSKVHVGAAHQLDGTWGNGGALYSLDGGATWTRNENMALKTNLENVVVDPNDPDKLFYLFFGGGLLHGPRPR
ncbi:MAG: hypothetical protein HY901_04105 [Deltaproteobacteria bacterium]|nr:hypothetical protein [Deltaproteobacteria bacterium]